MTAAIPASAIVAVTPSVISAGGSALDFTGLILTSSTQVPIGAPLSFPSAAAVATYFGASSDEAAKAAIYFLGFDNSNIKPAAILFAQYPVANVGAYLRGASVAALTVAQLQALSGVLVVTIDGSVKTSSSIDLSGAASFSAAATLIATALGATGPVGASVTGSISTTTLTVTAVGSGTLAVGQTLAGSGVTANTKITALGSGTGGTGTYTVGTSQTASSTTITATNPAVTYDSVAGAFKVSSGTTGASSTVTFGSGSISTGLKLTSATGAVLSQGAVTGVPATNMAAIIASNSDWASFSTLFKPSIADMILFATWTNSTLNNYVYCMWDNDASVITNSDATSAGAQIIAAGYSGTIPIYDPNDATTAVFTQGMFASIDFTELNGRATLAFKRQSGISPVVTDATIAAQLTLNGYNAYERYATRNDQFVFMYNGSVTGQFQWADSYVNQIWLNNALQLALMTLLTELKSIPYNSAGYALIEAACLDPINAAVNFGAIRAGVPLSSLQAAEVNNAAGLKIDQVLFSRGWYLQVLPASAQVRAARGSPPTSLWYMDGQSIQHVALASILIQ